MSDMNQRDRDLAAREQNAAMREQNQAIRENDNSATGLMLGILLLGVIGAGFGIFFMSQRNTPVPSTTIIERERTNVVPSQPAAAPNVNITVPNPAPPDVNITIPDAAPPVAPIPAPAPAPAAAPSNTAPSDAAPSTAPANP